MCNYIQFCSKGNQYLFNVMKILLPFLLKLYVYKRNKICYYVCKLVKNISFKSILKGNHSNILGGPPFQTSDTVVVALPPEFMIYIYSYIYKYIIHYLIFCHAFFHYLTVNIFSNFFVAFKFICHFSDFLFSFKFFQEPS